MRSNVQLTICLLYFSVLMGSCVIGIPVYSEEFETLTATESSNINATDLYVIRAVVYEVGILTEPDNSTDESEEVHEQVDLTFYDPQHNGSLIDLSNIPVPLQTNVSEQVITGLASVNLGSVQLPTSNVSAAPIYNFGNDNISVYPLPNAMVSVTTNLSTTNQETGSDILQGLPSLLGLPQIFNTTEKTERK